MNWLNLLHPVWYMDTDEGGTGGSSEPPVIDWTKVDPTAIPEDLIKKNPAYKTVLDESVQRRQEIKKLKDDAKKLGEEEPEDKSKKPVDEDKKVPKEEEVPAWAKQIIEKFTALETGTLDSWKQEAANEFGIKSKSVIKTLEGKTKDEVFTSAKTIAEELGIPKPAPSTTNPKINVGNVTTQRDKSVLEAAKANMFGTQKTSVFDPKVQESLGGGVHIIE